MAYVSIAELRVSSTISEVCAIKTLILVSQKSTVLVLLITFIEQLCLPSLGDSPQHIVSFRSSCLRMEKLALTFGQITKIVPVTSLKEKEVNKGMP